MSDYSKDSGDRLLPGQEHDGEVFPRGVYQPKRFHKTRMTFYQHAEKLIFLIVCLGVVVIGLVAQRVYTQQTGDLCRGHVKMLADDVVKFEAHEYGEWEKSPFVEEPSPVVEGAWNELLKHQSVGIPKEEMVRLGRGHEGIILPNGNYLATLNVFHDLHCLRGLYKDQFIEHYMPNMSPREQHLWRGHNLHCIDQIRQALMCHADTKLLTMVWGDSQPVPLANFTGPHECVNWQAIDEWSRVRHVNGHEPGVLIHPKYGPSFPNGKAPHRVPVAIDTINGEGAGV